MTTVRTISGAGAPTGLPFEVPSGALVWSIESYGGKDKCVFAGADGIGYYEWPVRELTIANVRARWGDGDYLVRFYGGKKAGDHSPCGRKRLTVMPLAQQEGTKKKKKRFFVPTMSGDPLATVLALQEGADARARAAIIESREFMKANNDSLFSVLGMVMGLRTEEAKGQNSEVLREVRRLAAENAELRARLDARDEEDDDDDDEEEDDDDATPAEVVEPEPKTAKEAIERVGATIVKKGIPAVGGFIGGVLENITSGTTQKDPPNPPTTAPAVSS